MSEEPETESIQAEAEVEAETEAPAPATPPPSSVELPPDVPDPVPEGVRELLELFRGPLEAVSFPDVDGAVLEERCNALRAAEAEVSGLFAALEAAQTKLSDERTALEKCAERGLAYARVFASDNEELVLKLDALSLGTPKKAARKAKNKVPKAKAQKAQQEANKSEEDSPSETKADDSIELRADDIVDTELVMESDEEKMSA